MNNSSKELDMDLNEYDTKTRNTPWRIVIHYFVLGFLWIIFSDNNSGITCLLSINLSTQSFNSEEFIEYIKEQVEVFKIDTGNVEFEITEYSFLNDITKSVTMMNTLKSMGFKIALDDFGTRYSSLNYHLID